jgi:hypothetical protein
MGDQRGHDVAVGRSFRERRLVEQFPEPPERRVGIGEPQEQQLLERNLAVGDSVPRSSIIRSSVSSIFLYAMESQSSLLLELYLYSYMVLNRAGAV